MQLLQEWQALELVSALADAPVSLLAADLVALRAAWPCSKVHNPRILLMDCPLEYKKGENQTNVELMKEEDWWVASCCTRAGQDRRWSWL
jgi:hypothetical protein